MNAYEEAYKLSMENPEKFWGEAAEDISWSKPFSKVLDDSQAPFYKWFKDGECNTCYNALDRHVEGGRGDQLALIYDSPITGTQKKYTYRELLKEVSHFAGVLKSKGVEKGDRVIIYMPMIPEAAIAMLATARLGAIHSVVFGGFASNELAVRINDAKPKAIISASCGLEPNRTIPYKNLLDEAINLSESKPSFSIIYQRPQVVAELKKGFDFDWEDEMKSSSPSECTPVKSEDPLYILYTSGTTGEPKGVVRDNGGHLVALNWTMKNIYGVEAGDVYWAASDVGWVVGHSYIVYGPLIKGSTTVMFEGKPIGTPDAGVFWRMIEEHKINVLFTAPTAFRAIRREDPNAEFLKKYNLDHFRALFLAGERTDPDTLEWAMDILKVPVIDHWWQTETGWAIAANCLGLYEFPVKPGSPTKAVPGWDIQVLDDEGHPVKKGDIGNIVCKLPLPPGTLLSLWKKDDLFIKKYLTEFKGYYATADAGIIDEDNYISIMSRTDDIINVAGHRLSTGAFEEVLAHHSSVAECAVVGIADKLKGQVPLGFIVLKKGVTTTEEEVTQEIVKMVRDKIGAVGAFKKCLVVERLPKTRSGKILRGTMQKIADDLPYKMPATIDDPAILDEIKEIIKSH